MSDIGLDREVVSETSGDLLLVAVISQPRSYVFKQIQFFGHYEEAGRGQQFEDL